MRKTNLDIAFTSLKTRGVRASHSKSTFLAYVDATLEVTLDEGTIEVCKLRIRNMQAKVVNGKFHLDMPSEKVVENAGEPNEKVRYIPHVIVSGISRTRLTNAMRVAYVAHRDAEKAAA